MRWVILLIGVCCNLAGFWYLMMPDYVGLIVEFPASMFLALGLFFVSQWLFLMPVRRDWLIRLTRYRRPMKGSVIGAAAVAAILSAGAVAILLEVPRWEYPVADTLDQLPGDLEWTIVVVMLGVWTVWAIIFWIGWKGGDRFSQFSQLGRMVRRLTIGTALELIVATGIYAWNPHNNNCECSRGSWFGLVLGGTAACWLFGPGLVLLFMLKRYELERVVSRCSECGYDLRGNTESKMCPECGCSN